LHCYTLKFSLLAQIFRWPVAIKTGICSRQDAKNAKSGSLILCGSFDVAQDMLCAFARDIPSLGCGSAALGSLRLNISFFVLPSALLRACFVSFVVKFAFLV
jgi:hypothetical protein